MRDLRFKKITDSTIFDDGYLKVTAIPTQHCPDSHAFFVEAEGKAVLFTGDLKHPNVRFSENRQGKADRIYHLRGRTLPGDRLRARFGRLSHKAGARQPLRAVEYPERHAACGNTRSAPVKFVNDGMQTRFKIHNAKGLLRFGEQTFSLLLFVDGINTRPAAVAVFVFQLHAHERVP